MELNKKFIPKFEVKTTTGKDLIFGEGSKKPTLLVLFTTWCDSCQKAAPAISKAFAYAQEKINLVGIGREHAAHELEEWGQQTGLVYQLVEEIDSVYTYEKIQNFKLDGRDVIVHSFDAKMTQLKFIENNKLIYGSSVQDGGKSNIYNKKIDKIKASISTRKILSRTNIYKHR